MAAEPNYFKMLVGTAEDVAPPPAAVGQPQPAATEPNYFKMLAGTDEPASARAPNLGGMFPPKYKLDPNAEADAPTWLGRRKQDIVGKHDPRYKDIPAYTGSYAARMGAGLTTHDDAAYGDIVAKSLGDKLVRRFKDANGYDLIDYKDEQGATRRAYVNKPGLDRYDISRSLMSAVPFVATGGAAAAGAAARGMGLAARAAAQAGTATATSVGQDVAAGQMGSEQGVSGSRALLFGGLGAGGEVAAAAVKPLLDKLAARGYVRDGVLTPEGEAIAREAGLDPAQVKGAIAQEFGKTYAMTRDAAHARIAAQGEEFGIPASRGQVTKRPDLLHDEEAMRRGLKGDAARNVISSFDERQKTAIADAALGGTRRTAANEYEVTGVAPKLAPARISPDLATPTGVPGSVPRLDKTDFGELIGGSVRSARDAAKAQERAAWEQPIDMMAGKQALAELPGIIDGKLAGMTIDPQITPAAGKMADLLKSYHAGESQSLGTGVFGSNPRMATVDEMRRRLGGMVGAAQNDADRAAAKGIYAGFNEWIETASSKALLSGDTQAAVNLRKAIDITREYRGMFNPRDAGGRDTPAGRILTDLLKDEAHSTPEGVIRRLFGGQPLKSQAPPPGTVQALRSLKDIFERYGDKTRAAKPWDDVRLAYWTRLVQDNKGEMLTPGNLVNNIRGAFANQRSVMETLYSPAELGMMRRFMAEVERTAYKPPNASGSSYGVAQFGQKAAELAIKALRVSTAGLGDKIILAMLKPVGEQFGARAASKAIAPQSAQVPHTLAPYGAAVGAATDALD